MKSLKKIKITTTIVVIIFSTSNLFAQWTGTNPVTTNSDVGISTSSPSGYLHISPTYSGNFFPPLLPLILADYNWYGTQITTFTATNGGKVGIGTANPTQTCHVVGTTLLQGNTTVQGNTTMNGSLTINNGTANQFQVTSNGLVVARQIDVHLDPIPDYVFHAAFDKDSAAYYDTTGVYKPMTLQQVDTFVQANRHLPGVKSAADYQKVGTINVGELQLTLLQKVEELTLYNIQLMKQIEELKKKQSELEQKLLTVQK